MSVISTKSDVRVADVAFTEDDFRVTLMDGRTTSVPLAWYPRRLHALRCKVEEKTA